jgi:hypothetical protein
MDIQARTRELEKSFPAPETLGSVNAINTSSFAPT